jgi:hypothetical protein
MSRSSEILDGRGDLHCGVLSVRLCRPAVQQQTPRSQRTGTDVRQQPGGADMDSDSVRSATDTRQWWKSER